MSTSFKTSMFGGFDRSDVIAYIEKTGREHEERVAALEAENETLRKENQTLENTQRVTQAQLLKMRDNEETCRRLRRQLADAEARNQELEQRCAQLKVQADEYESLKDHVAQIEISAHRRTEQFREEAVTKLRQLAARQREWCRTAQADYEQMNCQLLERLQQAEQTLRQPDMSTQRFPGFIWFYFFQMYIGIFNCSKLNDHFGCRLFTNAWNSRNIICRISHQSL